MVAVLCIHVPIYTSTSTPSHDFLASGQDAKIVLSDIKCMLYVHTNRVSASCSMLHINDMTKWGPLFAFEK